ncbi:hypothetical protein LAZ67_7001324 [Cordylochernes scorpioides]|uniref:Peptidase S1 domain-containing protein n=1 Tax=Cordylochernes scorpioides TaxID=51811 RepID=A0ABY6KQE2_9ARAC|nr:hypothetical protein LAZ67_7001324 [Cordylochernes scorpioides]
MPPKRKSIGRSTSQGRSKKISRASESVQQRNARLEAVRIQTAQARSNETVQQRNARLEADRIQTAQARSNESIAQRETRLGTNRERNVRSRRTLHADLNRAAFHYDAEYDYSLHPSVVIDKMDKLCKFCDALKFKNETPGMCCAGGKVKLPELHLPPEPLSTLISGATSQSKHFLRNIRKYNSCFQMTSFGATEIIRDNYMPTFKVQGQICHRVGSLLPLPDSDHKFLQIYFMGNTDDQVNQRCRFNSSTNQEIVSSLQNLYLHLQQFQWFIQVPTPATVPMVYSGTYTCNSSNGLCRYLHLQQFHWFMQDTVEVIPSSGGKDYDYVGEFTPDGGFGAEDEDCTCVPYYLCQDNHVITDGTGILDPREKPLPDKELSVNITKPYFHRCGTRNPNGLNSRILGVDGKNEADFGEWPWQAAVLKSENKVEIFQCGATLIDARHVVTVAHCVQKFTLEANGFPLLVRVGEWDTQSTNEFLPHEDHKVAHIAIHPEFRPGSLWNDVAVLTLEDEVTFKPHIESACLPRPDDIFENHECVVTGWGKNSFKGGRYTNIMKEVNLNVLDNHQCQNMLRKTRLGRRFLLHEGFLCAGGEEGKDSCKGDGGGPMVCYNKDHGTYTLAGLVSWGIDCGQPGVPGVYVRVQKYVDWIAEQTGLSHEDYFSKGA